MSAGRTVIAVEGLAKRYRIGETHTDLLSERLERLLRRGGGAARAAAQDFWALSDVSFTLEQGQILGVIGRNGAGKSTLLKILSRITRPTAGRAELRGRIASLLEVGTGFHPELTGRENIFLNGAILGMRRREIVERFDEIVAFAEVERFIDTPVKRYSSGMYVRLAFAVAAHLEPEILLIDEVLAVGDAEFQKKCLGRIATVARAGRTVLFVSHNIAAIERLCDVVLLLDGGRVARFDRDVAGVARAYLHGGGERREAAWSGDGGRVDNEYFSLRRLLLADAAGAPLAMPVRCDAAVRVRIEGVLKQAHPGLTIGCAVYDEDGNLLFWSYPSDVPEERWPRLAPGPFVLSAALPPHLLNEGTYRVECVGGIHNQEWLLEPAVDAPAVTLVVQGGLSDSPHWAERRPGILAPVLDWSVER